MWLLFCYCIFFYSKVQIHCPFSGLSIYIGLLLESVYMIQCLKNKLIVLFCPVLQPIASGAVFSVGEGSFCRRELFNFKDLLHA